MAVVRLPVDASAAGRAAAALELSLADVSMRLRGTLPRVLLVDADPARIEAGARALEALGYATVALDPAVVPRDDERIVARTLELGPHSFTAVDAAGARHECPLIAVDLILRGVRVSATREVTTTSERKFSVGKALLTGGLMMTNKVKTTHVKNTESREHVVLVHRNDGAPDVALLERHLDYRFLGGEMQPSSFQNLELTLARLRSLSPSAIVDDRATRPGFVSGLPQTSADPVDLALYLVALAHASERARSAAAQ